MNGYGGSDLAQRGRQILIALLIGGIAIGAFAIRGCQPGPFGRRQIVTLSPRQEIALGAQAYGEVLGKARVISTGPVVRDVETVTSRLIQATRNPEFLRMTRLTQRPYEWEVKVVRSREANAFCLPGGKMVVYTAILPICETDAGLATVMGHEISHALARHGAERMAQQQMAQLGIGAAGATLGNMDPQQRQSVMMVLNAGAQFGILRYSRKHESEADHIGLIYMARAGYPPEAAVEFWQRFGEFNKQQGGDTPWFLRTHPLDETRAKQLQGWIPEAKQQAGQPR